MRSSFASEITARSGHRRKNTTPAPRNGSKYLREATLVGNNCNSDRTKNCFPPTQRRIGSTDSPATAHQPVKCSIDRSQRMTKTTYTDRARARIHQQGGLHTLGFYPTSTSPSKPRRQGACRYTRKGGQLLATPTESVFVFAFSAALLTPASTSSPTPPRVRPAGGRRRVRFR
jgi:hypothetical protein